MVAPRSQPQTQAQLLEAGNVIFFYRPKPGVQHPQSANEIAETAFATFPDDPAHHQNRLFAFLSCVFPPIIPDQDLPEERGFAYVSVVSAAPRELIEVVEQDMTVDRTLARVVGDGRYAIARSGSETYLTYALRRPRQLDWAQKTVLLASDGVYKLRVQEPAMPTPVTVVGSPDYPEDLAACFDGHTTIPAEPVQLLDYQWTRVYLFSSPTSVQQLGIPLAPKIENESERDAFQQLDRDAGRIQLQDRVDVYRPIKTAELE